MESTIRSPVSPKSKRWTGRASKVLVAALCVRHSLAHEGVAAAAQAGRVKIEFPYIAKLGKEEVQPSQSCEKSPNMTVNSEPTKNGGGISKVSEQICNCFEIN